MICFMPKINHYVIKKENWSQVLRILVWFLDFALHTAYREVEAAEWPDFFFNGILLAILGRNWKKGGHLGGYCYNKRKRIEHTRLNLISEIKRSTFNKTLCKVVKHTERGNIFNCVFHFHEWYKGCFVSWIC